jgi:AhpD family alkylhydroperoxidase
MSTTTTHSTSPFADLTPETAPVASRPRVRGVVEQLGVLPAAVARMAASPQSLEAFQRLIALYDATTLDPAAREVVTMVMATRNGCELCVAMHTATLVRLDADEAVVAALRGSRPLPDARLDAVRTFTLRVLETAGAVPDDDLAAFRAAGFTLQNALEIVLGIATYTLSTVTNRLTRAPLDVPALEPFAWQPPQH